MSDRVFSADEVNAALKLAGLTVSATDSWTASMIRRWWKGAATPDHIAAIALGVLPDGWVLTYDSRGALYVYNGATWYISAQEGTYGADGTITSDNFTEAARCGQVEIAGRILAADGELERLRAGGAA